MNLPHQIKTYRHRFNLSQEGLADRVFVSRQTISNWETGKSYPDVHSLLLLGNVFGVSLDELVKGDLEMMKKSVDAAQIKKFEQLSLLYTVLLVLLMVSAVPLVYLLGLIGIIIFVCLFAVSLYVAIQVERFKKQNDIQTYQEILAFMQGKKLDDLAKAKEQGKRPYQKFFLAALVGVITLVICLLFLFLIKTL